MIASGLISEILFLFHLHLAILNWIFKKTRIPCRLFPKSSFYLCHKPSIISHFLVTSWEDSKTLYKRIPIIDKKDKTVKQTMVQRGKYDRLIYVHISINLTSVSTSFRLCTGKQFTSPAFLENTSTISPSSVRNLKVSATLIDIVGSGAWTHDSATMEDSVIPSQRL